MYLLNKQITIIIVLGLSLFTVLLMQSLKASGMIASPVQGVICEWSAPDGATLEGPEAMLSVTWSSSDHEIVNNTLQFQVGTVAFNQSGKFNNNSEVVGGTNVDHVYQAHFPAGEYYFELGWDDPGTDLDGFVYRDILLRYPAINFNSMATLNYPEKVYAALPAGDYWIVVDWWSGGNFPVDYLFFIGTEDFFFHENRANGTRQTFNTELLPDNTYNVTAICYDSEGNRYSENRTYTFNNQFPPAIDWVRVNGIDINLAPDLKYEHGSTIVIEWQTSDINTNDAVFASLYYKGPGEYRYSLLFSFLNTTYYSFNWDISSFRSYGRYDFRLEVINEDGNVDSAGTAEFTISILKLGYTTTTSTSRTQTYETPAFTIPSLVSALLALAAMLRRKKAK